MVEHSQHAPLAGRRILIVDDSRQITSLLRDVFASCEARTTGVNNGQTAMVQLQLGAFDLVLLDLVMPAPDGWDVLRFMRSVQPGLLERTILLTGDRYHCGPVRHIGETDIPVVYKPFDVYELRSIACEVLAAVAASGAPPERVAPVP